MKIYSLFFTLLLTSIWCSAQLIHNTSITANKADYENKKSVNQKSLPIWEVTFDEETQYWTFGSNLGTKSWAVGDTTPTHGFTNLDFGNEVSPLWLYMGWRYVHDYSESGGNFAWIDGVSDLLGYTPLEAFESYIQFDDIDLSSTSLSKVTFFQNYKKYKYDQCFIDFSVDEGITWTSVQVNEDENFNTLHQSYCEIFIPQNINGNTDVTMRFRWLSLSTNPTNGSGYGWELDDISIIENHNYDLAITDTRVNFFEYIDYTLPGNSNLYHHSSHYGKIPQSIFSTDLARIYFNVEVQNNGDNPLTPIVSVTVYDPEMTVIYYNNITSANSIAPHSKDTIDFIDQEFYPGSEPQLGLYTIEFEVADDGELEQSDYDNNKKAYFEITNGVYSRALFEPVESESPANYELGGSDGDVMGSVFIIFDEVKSVSMDIYISENSEPGAFYIGVLSMWDEITQEYSYQLETGIFEVEESDLGKWKTLYFNEAIILSPPPTDNKGKIVALVETYYGPGNKKLCIGSDNSSAYSKYGTLFRFMSNYQWTHMPNSVGGLCINLNLESTITCPESKSVCITDEPFALVNGVCQHCEFDGPGVSDAWFYPEIAGVGTHTINYAYIETNFTCDFNIIVNESPDQKTVTRTPANGILEPENLGAISILQSDLETVYYVTKNDIVVTDMISGTGSDLVLGNQFTQGAYQIWVMNSSSCAIPLDIVNFAENSGTSKIVVSSTFGEIPVLLNRNDVTINLYQQVNNGKQTTTSLVASLQPGADGQVIFNDLSAGTYFISSTISESYETDLCDNVFFENAILFDNATAIELTDGQILFIEILHEPELIPEGFQSVEGTVAKYGTEESLIPVEGKVVILQNSDTQEIMDLDITDENGHYDFLHVPIYTNIKIYVSMPESPVWTAYTFFLDNAQSIYYVDFIVNGNSVYPLTTKIDNPVNNITNIEIFPNPVAEILNIKSENNISEAVIYDISGRMLISVKGENIIGISTQNISAGSYLLICTDENGVPFVNKFVKE